MKKVGRLAFRSIIYFEIVTTLALVIGLVLLGNDLGKISLCLVDNGIDILFISP